MKKLSLLMAAVLIFSSCASTSVSKKNDGTIKPAGTYKAISLDDFKDGFSHARFSYKDEIPPYPLYHSSQIDGIALNMINLQHGDGGWEKNIDFQRVYTEEEIKAIQEKNSTIPPVTYGLMKTKNGSTMDNRNIYSQVKYLVQVYKQIPDKKYLDCAIKAIEWILNAQHPVSGGFTGADVYAITYNDDVMSNALSALLDIATNDDLYSKVPSNLRKKARNAYDRGLECILKTQITVTLDDGTKLLTAWCQQHDHDTLAPIWAREYEAPSICSAESRKVALMLMNIENPSEEVKKAIIACCEFFDRDDVRIHGKRLVRNPIPGIMLGSHYYDFDQVLIDDPSAPDCWARFYALDSSFDITLGARTSIKGTYPKVLSPIWCDRGCKFVEDFNQISQERRNGYRYTNNNGEKLLEAYGEWKQKMGL